MTPVRTERGGEPPGRHSSCGIIRCTTKHPGQPVALGDEGIAPRAKARDPARQNRYSGENRNVAFSAEQEEAFRANKKAWENFCAMPPSYRRPATWLVVSAKREETRDRRLATLIADSLAGRRIRQLIPPKRKT